MTTPQGKIIQFDYDWISSKDDTTEYMVCLTWAERQILLTILDYVGWSTRWHSPTGQTISQDKITLWRDRIAGELMFGDCLDCTDVWACLGVSGELPDDLLAWLIDQLETDGDVITIINNPPVGVVAPIATETMVEECDKDHVFAFALQLVQFINAAIEDAFQLLEAVSNSAEFAMVVLRIMPAAVSVAEFVAYLQNTLAEEYLAEYTTTLENQYACDIMCMIVAQENCAATWEDLYEHFLNRFGAGLENKNIIDLLTFIGGGGFSGTVFCDAAFALFCGFMYYGDKWLDLTLEGIQHFWESWLNDTNTDWTTLCSTCGWALDQSLDSGHTETYWEATCGVVESDRVSSEVCVSQGYRGLIINITFPQDAKLNRVKTYSRYDGLGETGIGIITLFDDEDAILQQDQWSLPTAGAGWDTHIKYFDQIEVRRVKLELIASYDPGEGGYTATNQIQLDGSGDDPFA